MLSSANGGPGFRPWSHANHKCLLWHKHTYIAAAKTFLASILLHICYFSTI